MFVVELDGFPDKILLQRTGYFRPLILSAVGSISYVL
jgi:hypothetical protein